MFKSWPDRTTRHWSDMVSDCSAHHLERAKGEENEKEEEEEAASDCK